MNSPSKPNATIKPVNAAVTATTVVANLAKLNDWRLVGDGADIAIEKTFSFSNYYQTMAFVNAVAFIAHSQDHHPALSVHYKHCAVRFNSHDVGGLSMRDFESAALVDALLL
jgi:4a-hydroxytetrahydrobiopterin dehydratase